MAYSIVLLRAARRALAQLPDDVYDRVWTAIQALAQAPRPHGCVKLTGSPYWRIRIGDYRVLYEINDRDLVVTVVNVANPRDVY